MSTREDTPSLPQLPPELIVKIMTSVPNKEVTSVLRAARLVSRAWNWLFLPTLFQDVVVAFCVEKWGYEEEIHTLELLCEFFASSPDVCFVIRTLKIDDDLSQVEEDEAEDEDSDEEEDQGDSLRRFKCETSPALLRRALSYLPKLQNLSLHYVLIGSPLLELTPDIEAKPLNLENLRITLPGWDNTGWEATQTKQLVCNTLTMFDSVEALRVNVDHEDLEYVGLEITDLLDTHHVTRYKLKSLTALHTTSEFLRTVAAHPAFSNLTALNLQAWPRGMNELFTVVGTTLERLTVTLFEPSRVLTGPQVITDLSVCRALQELTIIYFLPIIEVRQNAMVGLLIDVLSTILRRPHPSPPLNRLIIRILPRCGELLQDGSWPLFPSHMHTFEDKLLQLVDAGVCNTIRFEVNLSNWYHARAWRVKLGFERKEVFDAQYDTQVKHSLHTLWDRFPRLEKRGVLQVVALPVDLDDISRL